MKAVIRKNDHPKDKFAAYIFDDNDRPIKVELLEEVELCCDCVLDRNLKEDKFINNCF